MVNVIQYAGNLHAGGVLKDVSVIKRRQRDLLFQQVRYCRYISRVQLERRVIGQLRELRQCIDTQATAIDAQADVLAAFDAAVGELEFSGWAVIEAIFRAGNA